MTRALAIVAVLLLFGTTPSLRAEEYSSRLAGKRLVLVGARSAGIAFVDAGTIVGYAELTGEHPVFEATVRWLESDLFLATEKGRNQPDCPPRLWLYRVLAYSGESVKLHEYWTGWPILEDSVADYAVVSLEDPD